ncbi:MAG: ATP-binding cassette domain-containing protein [Clostridia bacterium]|nr:ATP-binding cassette domain-containing protein [Clostridia bacterium]
MNAIEIRGLCKAFGEKNAVAGLDMTVPQGAIYGFIGENGSGKSTTEKIITGLIHPTGGTVSLFDRPHTDRDVRARIGVLIEAPGCFPSLSVFNNMLLQAENLGLRDKERAVVQALKTVRMEGAASNKYKNCSLGMKQRVGIAMALLGNPALLVLDEPINGLDADGMRIMREILTELSAKGITILVSSHILSELEKIATHYGIIRGGRMLREMTAEELEADCPTYVAIKLSDVPQALAYLLTQYPRVEADEEGYLRVYGAEAGAVSKNLYANGYTVSEIRTAKISLEEYYISLMKEVRG